MIRTDQPLQVRPLSTSPHSAMRERRWQRRLFRSAGVSSMEEYRARVNAEIDRQTAAA